MSYLIRISIEKKRESIVEFKTNKFFRIFLISKSGFGKLWAAMYFSANTILLKYNFLW